MSIFLSEPRFYGAGATRAEPRPGLAESVADGWEAGRRIVNMNGTAILEEEETARRINAIAAATGSSLPNPYTDQYDEVDEKAIRARHLRSGVRGWSANAWDEIRARRREAFEARVETLAREYPDKDIPGREAALAAIRARAGDLESQLGEAGVGGFVGAVGASFTDPVNLMTLPLGGGAKSVLGAALREAGINMGLEAALTPFDQARRKHLELSTGLDEAALNVAIAGAFGAVAGGGVRLGEKAFGAMSRREAIAAVDALPAGVKTPEIEAARDALDAELAADEAAGLEGGDPQMQAVHQATLDATIKKIEEIEPAAPNVSRETTEAPEVAAPDPNANFPRAAAPVVEIDGRDVQVYDAPHADLLQLALDREAGRLDKAEVRRRAAALLPTFRGLVADRDGRLIDDPGRLIGFADDWLAAIRSGDEPDPAAPQLESDEARAVYLDKVGRFARAPIERNGDTAAFDPDDLLVDARTFQFKAGGDAEGVTDALKGVKQWDPIKAGELLVWEDASGRVFVADGHQRSGLARRAKAAGQQNVRVRAVILREADGITAADARAIAAAKNIAQGTGSAADAAKVLKVRPDLIDGTLNPRSALIRDAQGLMRLGDDAFGMVINEVVPENYAAIVGRLIDDPAEQVAVLGMIARQHPANLTEAEAFVRQAKAAGFETATQESLFGTDVAAEAMLGYRASVLGRAVAQLRRDKRVFSTLEAEAGQIEAAGNRLAIENNREIAKNAAEIADIVLRTAHVAGPVADALGRAARHVAGGGQLAKAVRDFVGELRDLGPRALRELDSAGQGFGPQGRNVEIEGAGDLFAASSSRVGDAPTDYADGAMSKGAETQRDDLTADMFGDAERFAPPKETAEGPEPKPPLAGADDELVTGAFDVDQNGETVARTQTRAELDAEFAADEKAIDRLKGCVK